MKPDQIFLIFIATCALFFTIRFIQKWVTGGFNSTAVIEWMDRGFAFGIGLIAAFAVVILVMRVLVGDK